MTDLADAAFCDLSPLFTACLGGPRSSGGTDVWCGPGRSASGTKATLIFAIFFALPREEILYHGARAQAAVSGVGLTRLVNKQDIRTLQRIENRACNDPRILATDAKPISCGLFSMRVMCLENGIRN
jgi:hypothetical protein